MKTDNKELEINPEHLQRALTIREYFTLVALKHYFENKNFDNIDDRAKSSVKMADALIKELSKDSK